LFDGLFRLLDLSIQTVNTTLAGGVQAINRFYESSSECGCAEAGGGYEHGAGCGCGSACACGCCHAGDCCDTCCDSCGCGCGDCQPRVGSCC
jgi:hypothetical protein